MPYVITSQLIQSLTEITISEGRKRQIRRMMKAVHCCVIELKRISIEDIILDETLSPGEWKEIFPL